MWLLSVCIPLHGVGKIFICPRCGEVGVCVFNLPGYSNTVIVAAQ